MTLVSDIAVVAGQPKPLEIRIYRVGVKQFVDGQVELPSLQARKPSSPLLHGWRRWGAVLGLDLGLFLAMLEISIVSTALVQITDDLQISGQSSWVVISYLVTYSGFLIIWAQFSQVLGRKSFAIAAMIIFMAFSVGCASSRTSTQLIVLRAFQGIGGSGIYNMATVIVSEAVRPDEIPKFVSLAAVFTALAFALGPLVGGAITSQLSWRWVFWINIPFGAVSLVATMFCIPSGFPHHTKSSRHKRSSMLGLQHVDFLGALLFLCTTTCLVTALQEANVSYAWDATVIVDLLLVSGLFLVLFILWERFVSLRVLSVTPVLSWTLAERRSLGLFISSFLAGAPFTCAVIEIAQRFQIVYSLSAIDAGVRLLPYIVMTPVGSMVGPALFNKFKLRPMWVLFSGTALQFIGAIGFSLLPYSATIPSYQYAYQVIFGLGAGMNISLTISSVPLIVDKKNIPSALGAITQFRSLGGAIGLGIVSAAFNAYARPQLASSLTAEQVTSVLQSITAIGQLEPSEAQQVLQIFDSGFSLQWEVILGFVGAQIPAALLLW